MITSQLKKKTFPFLFIFCAILLSNISMNAQDIYVVSQNNCSTIETSEVHVVDENSGELFSDSYPVGNFTFILSSPDASYTQSNNAGVFIGIPDGMNYFVIIHDNINNSQYQCPSTFQIYTDNSPIIEVYLLTQPICPGDSVAYQVNLICGSTGEVTYYFSNSEVSLSNNTGYFTGINGGTFYIEDESGTMSNTIVMESPFLYEPLGLQVPVVSQNCDSTGNAVISAQAIGGDGNYTYYIIDVATGISEQNNSGIFYANEGSFYVGVSDGSGCNHQCPQLTIVEPCCQLSVSASITDVLCPTNSSNSGNLGSILLSISGGTAPYVVTDNWGNVTTDINSIIVIDNLYEGNYSFIITDSEGCSFQTASYYVDLPEDYAVQVIASTYDCNTGLVDVTIEFSGYNPDGGGYFTWAFGSTPAITTIFGLTPGEVVSTIICPDITLEQCPGNISFIVPDAALNTFEVGVEYDYCPSNSGNSANNGNTTFTFTGGSPPYYVSDGSNTYTSTDFTVLVDGLEEGIHAFAVYDAQGCTQNIDVTIEQPDDYAYEILDYTYDCTTGLGALTVEFSGYNPDGGGYYLWGYGTLDAIHTFEGLTPGEVITTTICPSAFLEACPGSISITAPAEASSFNVEVDYVFCPSNSNNDFENGNTSFTFSGGVGPYSVTYNNIVYTSTADEIFIENLAIGTYSLVASDASGCTQIVDVVIEQPDDYAYEILDYAYDCNTGLIDLTVEFSGYNPDGEGYYLSGYGTIEAIYTFEGLTPGDVISSTICPAIFLEACPGTITIDVPFGLEPFEVLVTTEDLCPGNPFSGSVTFEFLGNGTSYSITGATGTVYPLSQNGTSITIDNLTAGIYDFIASDGSSCAQSIVVNINGADPYTATIIDYYFDCASGLADVTVEFSGYNPDGGGYYLLGYGDVDVIHTFQGLTPGEMIGGLFCPAINLEQCPGNISFTVPNDYQGIFGLDADYTCIIDSLTGDYGGQINLYMIGGQAPYVIIASDGSSYTTMNDIYVTDMLSDGTYSFTVYDINGCEAYYSITVDCTGSMAPNVLGNGTSSFVLFPNPMFISDQFLRISYDIIEINKGDESYHLAITELATGREIEVKQLANTKGIVLLDIKNYPVGSFICTLYPDQRNRVVNSQQFIIQRK